MTKFKFIILDPVVVIGLFDNDNDNDNDTRSVRRSGGCTGCVVRPSWPDTVRAGSPDNARRWPGLRSRPRSASTISLAADTRSAATIWIRICWQVRVLARNVLFSGSSLPRGPAPAQGGTKKGEDGQVLLDVEKCVVTGGANVHQGPWAHLMFTGPDP
jgi:hypothetical protein